MAIVGTDDKHYKAIAEEIRRHTSSVGALTPEQMPDAIAVACDTEFSMGYYEGEQVGGQNQREEFWDSYLSSGIPGNFTYRFAGYGWNDTTFKPTKDLIATADSSGMFTTCKIVNLTKCLEDAGVVLDFSQCTKRVDLMFAYSNLLEDIPVLDFRNAKRGDNSLIFNDMFQSCSALRIIRGIYISDDGSMGFRYAFDGCKNLEEVYFHGVIGRSNLDLHYSTKLTHDSLMNVIECLKDYSQDTSGTSWVLTIGTTNINKLTDAEKAIATEKGWTLA